jgi:hypothetical protein
MTARAAGPARASLERIEHSPRRLKQEQAAFEQGLRQNAQWFNVQRTIVYGAVVGLLAILVASGYILLSGNYSARVTTAAATFIFGDMASLFAGVWKVVVKGLPNGPVEPTTALAPYDDERHKPKKVSRATSRPTRARPSRSSSVSK